MKQMKRVILLMIIAFLMGCEKSGTIDKEKIFDFNDVSLLNISDLKDYWGSTVKIDTSYFVYSSIPNDSNFIGGIRFFGVPGQDIEIHVFKSKDNALKYIDPVIEYGQCLIKKGTSNAISGEWWYAEWCFPNSVYVCKWNTVIRVSYGSGNFDPVKDKLYNTANELVRRIDRLSK